MHCISYALKMHMAQYPYDTRKNGEFNSKLHKNLRKMHGKCVVVPVIYAFFSKKRKLVMSYRQITCSNDISVPTNRTDRYENQSENDWFFLFEKVYYCLAEPPSKKTHKSLNTCKIINTLICNSIKKFFHATENHTMHLKYIKNVYGLNLIWYEKQLGF